MALYGAHVWHTKKTIGELLCRCTCAIPSASKAPFTFHCGGFATSTFNNSLDGCLPLASVVFGSYIVLSFRQKPHISIAIYARRRGPKWPVVGSLVELKFADMNWFFFESKSVSSHQLSALLRHDTPASQPARQPAKSSNYWRAEW